MAAKKKSASRRSAAKKAKSKKAPKRPVAKKAATRKRVPAAKKKAAARPKSAAKIARPPKAPSPALAEIDRRIALVQNNLRDLTEQAAATSGSGSEDALSDRITGQEAELQRLRRERDALVKSGGG
jgi:hypothetical protein